MTWDAEAQRRGFMQTSGRRDLITQVVTVTANNPGLDEFETMELVNKTLENSSEGEWDPDYPGVMDTVREAMMRTRQELAK